jgi:hypothetical protein
MTFKSAIVAMAFILSVSEAFAADASKPDAASIMNAMYAAVGVGNVDAAVSFFADDGYNIGPGGNKTTGKQELRTLIDNRWVPENLQMGMVHYTKVRDNQTIIRFDVSSKWLTNLEVSPAQTVHIVTIEDNKIKSVNAPFTLASLEKMMQACDARPDSKMPSGAPCGTAISASKKYTDSLITQGIAEKE